MEDIGVKELDLLVKSEEEKYLISKTLISYPVDWDIVRDMIFHGLTGCQIKMMCEKWSKKGYPIRIAWNNIRVVLHIIN